MIRANYLSNPARRALQVLVWVAALAVVACDNDVNFNPTAPTFPNFTTFPNATTVGEGRNLEIRGTLTAGQGSCLEATVLYDGKELPGGRSVCQKASGCPNLELTADVSSSSGQHTISFQVLNQSPETVDYVAEGKVLVFRAGMSLEMTIDLEPTRATLQSGESVAFKVRFVN